MSALTKHGLLPFNLRMILLKELVMTIFSIRRETYCSMEYIISFFFTESNKQQNKLHTCSSAMGPIFHFLLQETKSKLKISGHRWIIQTLKNVQENNMILALSRKYILLEQSRLKRKEFLILIGVVGIIIHITWNIYEHFLLSPWGNKQFRLIWNFSKVSWDSHTTHTP